MLLNTAKMEGLEEGLTKGREEGRAEGLVEGERRKQEEIARNLKESQVAAEVIAAATGLSLEEIRAL